MLILKILAVAVVIVWLLGAVLAWMVESQGTFKHPIFHALGWPYYWIIKGGK